MSVVYFRQSHLKIVCLLAVLRVPFTRQAKLYPFLNYSHVDEIFLLILGLQIYLTRTGSRGHHGALRAREPESTLIVETAANEQKKMISDLRPYSHYDLAIAVFNSKGEGPRSETMPFTTKEGGEHDKEGKNWEWKRGGELQ